MSAQQPKPLYQLSNECLMLVAQLEKLEQDESNLAADQTLSAEQHDEIMAEIEQERERLMQSLEITEANVAQKLDGIGCALANLAQDRDRKEAEARPFADEAARYRGWAVSKENAARSLKSMVIRELDRLGIKGIGTEHWRFTVATNGGKQRLVVNVPPEHLPEDCRRTVIEVDEDKLRQRIAAGFECDGVELLPRGRHLRVR